MQGPEKERRKFIKNFSAVTISCFLSSVLSGIRAKDASAGVCCYSNCYSVCYSDRGRR